MTETMIVSLCTLFGTILTAYMSIRRYGNLTEYKLNELTKRVDKHNNFIERLATNEKNIEVICEKISATNRRIDDLEERG